MDRFISLARRWLDHPEVPNAELVITASMDPQSLVFLDLFRGHFTAVLDPAYLSLVPSRDAHNAPGSRRSLAGLCLF
ncbi:MAG: hypothetical protein Q8Q09_16915 [Deltaproteobacteria bacterium]|nr:hypothetical protein [Deltaproteobacteria bacterium]